MKVKKNLLGFKVCLLALLINFNLKAQVSVTPMAFSLDEEITIRVDVTGTGLANATAPFYIWSWEPSNPKVGNDANGGNTWQNGSNEALKMTQDPNNSKVWIFKMKPSEFYSSTTGNQIQFLVKTKSGGAQTANYSLPIFDFNTKNQIATPFPKNFTGDDKVAIIFDTNEAWSLDGANQGELNSANQIFVKVAANDGEIEADNRVELNKVPGKAHLWRTEFVPSQLLNSGENGLYNLVMTFSDKDQTKFGLAPNGRPVRVGMVVPENKKIRLRVHPVNFTADQRIYITYDPSMEPDEDVKALEEFFLHVHFNNEEPQKIKLTSESNGTFSANFIVRSFLNAGGTTKIESLSLALGNESGDILSKVSQLDVSSSTIQTRSSLFTVTPNFPAYDEELTIKVDLTGTGLANNNGPFYIWTWRPASPSNMGSWGNSNEAMKMTNEGNNIWSFTMVPKDFYAVDFSPEVSFLVKNKSGSLQTGDLGFRIDESAAGLMLRINTPTRFPLVTEPGTIIPIQAESNKVSLIKVFSNDELIHEETTNLLNYFLYVDKTGDFEIKVTAELDDKEAERSFIYTTVTSPVAELPSGLKNGINYLQDDDTRAFLVLNAPYKAFVNVIGDFNNWEVSSAYLMNRTPDRQRFWIELTGLEPEKEYPFQYLVDGHIRIADPYTPKVLDPNHDNEIRTLGNYPNLLNYDASKLDGVTAAVVQTAQKPYQWQVTDFKKPAKEDLVIYELLIRDFTKEKTFQSVLDTLGYLKRLGINAIELMPINEFEGNRSWGYNPSFYFAVDKFYGSSNDFKRFVDECHKNGIAVILDKVFNHTFRQSPLLQLYYDAENYKAAPDNPWYLENHIFENSGMRFGYPFNHSSPHFRAFMDSANHYWLSEYKIDGYRFDLTKGFTTQPKGSDDEWGSKYDQERVDNLTRMSNKIWESFPDAYVILEHLAENSEETVLANNGMMLWANMHGAYGSGARGNTPNLRGASHKGRNWKEPHAVAYMESHDEERMMWDALTRGRSNEKYNLRVKETALERMGMLASFLFTIPGPKMLWQFGELGYDYELNNNRLEEKPIRWDYYFEKERKELYDIYSRLINLKINNEAFRSNNFTIANSGQIGTIHINHPSMDVVVFGNFGITEADATPKFQRTGLWFNAVTNKTFNVKDVNEKFKLAPGEYYVLTSKPAILSTEDSFVKNEVIIYPNPSNGIVYLKFEQTPKSRININIVDVYGKRLKSIEHQHPQNDYLIDITHLPKGLYILQIEDGKSKTSSRIVKQ
jgi:1,4-alpha-glucan branching enzyme